MKKTAIILGATGITGNALLKQLIKEEGFNRVILFSRKSIGMKHPKIEEHLVNVLEIEKQKHIFHAEVVFCCIGTTKAKTPNKEVYRKIDYGIPVTAAKLCKDNNIATFVVISALGANPKSSVFYNRIKGEMEQDVLKQEIENTFILQPSLIIGNRKEKRFGEKFAGFIFKFLKPVIPKKYQAISPETIAKAMIDYYC